MNNAHDFLMALTVVLGVAGVTTVVFQRLRQPVVLGYILAGLLIGPHVPVPIVASPHVVQTLSELGVILLMFGLGLEFSLAKLFRAAPTAGITGLLQCSMMLSLGYLVAILLGWTSMEALYTGALIAISSTTIIAKAFDEQRIRGPLREFVVAILIVEDLVAVILLALLTAVSKGSGVSASELAITVARLASFLIGLVVIGLLVVPRVMRYVVKLERPEMVTITSIGICFGIALLAQEFGYSVALGAFVAGVLVAESGKAAQIEPLVNPVRDIFAAVFFVAVGMMIDPAQIAAHWTAILWITLLVVVGKVTCVSFGAFMTGKGTTMSVSAGMSLAQIGEFSFIIAGLGVSLGVIGGHVYSVAVAVSAITTLLTPALIRRSQRFASFVDRKLPRPLQTFVSLYGSWVERLRASRQESRSLQRKFARTLLLDVAAIATGLIAISLSFDWEMKFLTVDLGIRRSIARAIIVGVGAAVILPFCYSVLRTTQRFAHRLGELAVPRVDAGVDLGRQPRSMVEAAVRLVGLLVVGSALIAITQPFLPGQSAAIALLIGMTILAIMFWRTATGLEGHVRAATQVVIEALASQSAGDAAHAHAGAGPAMPPEDPLAKARELFPGIGTPVRYEIPPGSPAIGRSLADLELRAATGATVLAVLRDGVGTAPPDAHEPLRAGDIVAVAGTDDAVDSALDLLESPRQR
jgi:CPA2 family monovalent cation:H+ antiporter-2